MMIPLAVKKESYYFSVIIPVFSEVESMRATVDRVLHALKGERKEIILAASPNSSPACLEACRSLAGSNPIVSFMIQKRVPGQGHAFREALQQCRGTHAVLMCADLETDPGSLTDMVAKLKETGAAVVVASRWMKRSTFRGYGRLKLMANWLFQKGFMILFRTPISDLTYVYKIISMDVVRAVDWEGSMHEFALETTLKPIKLGYRVEQVPTAWIARKEGRSHFKLWRNARHLLMACSILMGRPFPLRS